MLKKIFVCSVLCIILIAGAVAISKATGKPHLSSSNQTPSKSHKSAIGLVGRVGYIIETMDSSGDAMRAGLKAGDLIMKVNKLQFNSRGELIELILASSSACTIQYVSPYLDNFAKKGLQSVSLTPTVTRGVAGTEGKMVFLVEGLLPTSPAINSGIRTGDLISEVDGKTFESLQEFTKINLSDPGTDVRLKISRAASGRLLSSELSLKTVLPSELSLR